MYRCFAGAFCPVQVFSELVFSGDGTVTVHTTATSGLLVHILGTSRELAVLPRILLLEIVSLLRKMPFNIVQSTV